MEKLIICPYCGAEYLPAEIFYPDEFFGNPKNIEKDAVGKIQFYSGQNVKLTESYTCDYCKRKMYVNAEVDFTAQVQPFSNGYTTKFKKTSLFMDEE
jgi:hypothetical protein